MNHLLLEDGSSLLDECDNPFLLEAPNSGQFVVYWTELTPGILHLEGDLTL